MNYLGFYTQKTKEAKMLIAKPIKDFPGYYITDCGDVYSRVRQNNYRFHKVTAHDNGHGYLIVGLWKKGKNHSKKIHRLVADAFIPNPNHKEQVNHKDGNKRNNTVNNLEWCTPSENSLHRNRVLGYSGSMRGRYGKDCPYVKIVLQIKDNKVVDEFYGICEAQRQTGICCVNISACCRGKAKTAGGYQWKYKN